MLAVRTLGRVRARDSSCPDARSRVRSDGAGRRIFNFFLCFLSGTNRHELVIRISGPKFVCFNTNFLAFIDLGSKTYIGL